MAVLTAAFGMTACGNKKTDNTDATQVKQEQPSVADNNNTTKTKTGIVTFTATDTDGNTVTLEGKAVVQADGSAEIQEEILSGPAGKPQAGQLQSPEPRPRERTEHHAGGLNAVTG